MNSLLTEILRVREANQDDGLRLHLGASSIGEPCPRKLWYGFRWAQKQRHSARLLRLFETGHMEEARFIREIEATGCKVSSQQEQKKACDGHFGGSVDAIVEWEGELYVAEFKTHNDKSFQDLKDRGVKLSKPVHHAQMIVYCELNSISAAIYLAVNKETDELWCETVYAQPHLAEILLSKANEIIFRKTPPPRINDENCTFCTYANICYSGVAPLRTCRSCEHSAVVPKGRWSCGLHHLSSINEELQKTGCVDYEINQHWSGNKLKINVAFFK